jgi:cell division protein FtsW (lipid II flippase)
MKLVIVVIGIAFVCMGAFYLVKPTALTRIIEFFKQGKRMYLAAAIRLVLAVIFLLAARECYLPWVIGLLGMVFLASSLVIFAAGPEKLRPMMDWVQKRITSLAKPAGILIVLLGTLIIYSA